MTSEDQGTSPPSARRGAIRTGLRILAVVAFGYACAFIAVNAVDSPLIDQSLLHNIATAIIPRIGSANTLSLQSVRQEWDFVQNDYVVKDVNGTAASLAGEQGIVDYLHSQYNDRFSAVLAPQDSTNLQDSLSGKLKGGIGISLQERCGATTPCTGPQKPSLLVIEDVLKGMPADQAGLRNDDILVAVNGRTITSFNSSLDVAIDSVVNAVRGNPGTAVTLTIHRGGQDLSYTMTRKDLQIPSVYSQMLGKTLYVEINTFGSNTGADFQKHLSGGIARGATGVILDLRNNGGGLVDAATTVASQFLTPGSNEKNVVVRRGRLSGINSPQSAQQVVQDQIQQGGLVPKLPLAVLVNGDTASASEIVTMALRDYHRATVVGDKTFGKGSVQTDYTLPDGNDLHLTIERWYGPDGESIEGAGIAPQVPASLTSSLDLFRLETQSVDPSKDDQLQAALKVVTRQ